jgi:hypothetical protein
MGVSISTIVLGVAFLIAARLVVNYRRLSSANIPGPMIASITSLWRQRLMQRSSWVQDLDQLHRRYGKLVRLGPNYVSVADAASLPTIYGTTTSWNKACQHVAPVPSLCLHSLGQFLRCLGGC